MAGVAMKAMKKKAMKKVKNVMKKNVKAMKGVAMKKKAPMKVMKKVLMKAQSMKAPKQKVWSEKSVPIAKIPGCPASDFKTMSAAQQKLAAKKVGDFLFNNQVSLERFLQEKLKVDCDFGLGWGFRPETPVEAVLRPTAEKKSPLGAMSFLRHNVGKPGGDFFIYLTVETHKDGSKNAVWAVNEYGGIGSIGVRKALVDESVFNDAVLRSKQKDAAFAYPEDDKVKSKAKSST